MKSLFIFAIVCLSTYSFGQDINFKKTGIDENKHIPIGLNEGEKAPFIKALSIRNQEINSEKILLEKQIVVIFYRGKWCPVCTKYLNNLSDSLDLILQKDAIVLVIGPESIENAGKTEQKTNARFVIISDTDKKIQSDFDVLFSVRKSYQGMIKTFLSTNIAKNNNQEEAQLPVPATYIINQKGEISYKHFDYNYSNRATVKEILNNL